LLYKFDSGVWVKYFVNLLQVLWSAGEEKLINPFMRVHESTVQQHAGQNEATATMGFIRREKDNFKA
jgi:hydroxyacylglutathione hydrolase